MTANDRETVWPTRIIPAGQPLPTIDGPPGPDDLPPWWETAPPRPTPPRPEPEPVAEPEQQAEQPAAGGAPPPINVPPGSTVLVFAPGGADLTPVEAAEPRWWERVLARLQPWHTVAGGALALTPMPWTGYSVAATWQSCVWYAHEEAIPAAWVAAAVGVLVAYRAERRLTGGFVRTLVVRAITVTALIGITGAAHWWDPIQILTGVTRP